MSWYHSSMYDPAVPVGSFWEDDAPPLAAGVDLGSFREGEATCEVAIIGGGYTGLSAALHLARDHHTDVRLLETGPLGWGASGRNGGFCALPPSGLGFHGLIKQYGKAETKRFISSQIEAVELVQALARDEGIDYRPQGDGTLHVAHDEKRFAELEEEVRLWRDLFGVQARLMSREEVAASQYNSTEQYGAAFNPVGFGLQPMRFAAGLAAAAARHGAKLHGGSEVLQWEKREGWHHLVTKGGTLRARKVILAINGFIRPALAPRLEKRVVPVLSNIIVTRPLTEDERLAQKWRTERPCSNTRNLLFYYRMLPDKRFLFGARGDLTGKPEDGRAMRCWMEKRLGEVFPAWAGVETTHYWRGFVCMTRCLTPSIAFMENDRTALAALAYHGDGVSAAPWAGRMAARLIAGTADEADLPAPFRGEPGVIPFAALRRWYLRGALSYYRWIDL